MENVSERIRKRYNELTKGQKVVAKFILDEPKQVALHTAKSIGNLTGTSETTVIRLCYALGYKGFSILQEEIRKSLLNQKENPLKEFRDRSGKIEGENLIDQVMKQDITSIQRGRASIFPSPGKLACIYVKHYSREYTPLQRRNR